MKSHHPPDLDKIFNRPKPTAREIDESYNRARRARGPTYPNRLKDEPRGNRNE